MDALLSELKRIYESPVLPPHDDLLSLVDEGITVLEHESEDYRKRYDFSGDKKSGGLLDFTAMESLPLVVVPDLHARCDFFMHLMQFPLKDVDSLTVLDALRQGRIRVVCVGDLFHSERRGRERWLLAWDAYERGDYASPEMSDEMRENLLLFQMVLRVKEAFPSCFHFLKGNHENILNEGGRGNYPFRKFADEGNMVYDFMAAQYGDAVLHVMSLWEHSLPLCALFPNCVVSHAEPKSVYTREEIIAYEKNPAMVLGLTWTANDEAETGSVEQNLRNLLGEENTKDAVWLSGHRPVKERYALRQDGRLVQIHNPDREQIAVVLPGKRFEPETDVVEVGKSADNAVAIHGDKKDALTRSL